MVLMKTFEDNCRLLCVWDSVDGFALLSLVLVHHCFWRILNASDVSERRLTLPAVI
ncbi:hypothetical protein SynA18461_01287 [Synechococcus sp. A18-46.1]|nr:hypothetical protein SynA18461_01287 [Synechococcus sp. A18-46.1]